jgi:hypothetical protein
MIAVAVGLGVLTGLGVMDVTPPATGVEVDSDLGAQPKNKNIDNNTM